MNQILYTSRRNYDKLSYVTKYGELVWILIKNKNNFIVKLIKCINMCTCIIISNDEILYNLTIAEKQRIIDHLIDFSGNYRETVTISEKAIKDIEKMIKEELEEIKYIIN